MPIFRLLLAIYVDSRLIEQDNAHRRFAQFVSKPIICETNVQCQKSRCLRSNVPGVIDWDTRKKYIIFKGGGAAREGDCINRTQMFSPNFFWRASAGFVCGGSEPPPPPRPGPESPLPVGVWIPWFLVMIWFCSCKYGNNLSLCFGQFPSLFQIFRLPWSAFK
jgi:hypothetical protein